MTARVASAAARPAALRAVIGSCSTRMPSAAVTTKPIWAIGTSTLAGPRVIACSMNRKAQISTTAAAAACDQVAAGGAILPSTTRTKTVDRVTKTAACAASRVSGELPWRSPNVWKKFAARRPPRVSGRASLAHPQRVEEIRRAERHGGDQNGHQRATVDLRAPLEAAQ